MAIERIPLKDYDISQEGTDSWPPRPLLRGDAVKGRAARLERFRRKGPGGGPLRKGRRRLFHLSRKVWGDQAGITGLETAIVLIAFIVVAAVFAFAVLTTGLFTTEKAKQTAKAGLAEAQSTLSTKGAVIASANTALTAVTEIRFKLSNAAGADSITLTGAVLGFTDPDSSLRAVENATGFATSGATSSAVSLLWSSAWITGASPVVDPTEVVEITVTLGSSVLLANQVFNIELIPVHGAVLKVTRTTPTELKSIMNLE